MARSDEFNIVIISDLHLSEGRDPKTRKFNRNEDFFFDEEFDRFLNFLEIDSERRGRKWRLIIAGDMVDFLQITRKPEKHEFKVRRSEEDYGLGTSPEKTVWKMKVMMNGHWIFFRALGRFISRGNKFTIVTGNHDIEWTVPEVQKAFRDGMKKEYLPDGVEDPDVTVLNGIEFCPWFYYEPGLIWVEHGHQYDGMNSYDYFLFPYLPNSNELMLPGGSFFVRYLFNKIEQKDPFADNIKSVSSYIKKYGLQLLFSYGVMEHVQYFWKIIQKISKFESDELKYLNQKNQEGIEAEAARFGIEIEKLQAIKREWVPCFLYNQGMWKNIWSFITYRVRERQWMKHVSTIRKELEVRYIVMGHTHEVDLHLLNPDKRAEYSNSGTWTKIFSSDPRERLLQEEHEAVFIQIVKDEGNKLEVMKWRDDLGVGERVKLFEKDV